MQKLLAITDTRATDTDGYNFFQNAPAPACKHCGVSHVTTWIIENEGEFHYIGSDCAKETMGDSAFTQEQESIARKSAWAYRHLAQVIRWTMEDEDDVALTVQWMQKPESVFYEEFSAPAREFAFDYATRTGLIEKSVG